MLAVNCLPYHFLSSISFVLNSLHNCVKSVSGKDISMANRFLGVWRLIPAMCKYDVGQAPLKATYSFTPVPQQPSQIKVGISWTDKTNKDFSVDYMISLQGGKHSQQLGGHKVLVGHELTKEGLLRSTTFSEGGATLMDSWRQLKEEGKVLEVVMETATPNGKSRVFQRYERMQ